MTLEELKAEAKAQGYSLIPIKRHIPIKPCGRCGHKRTHIIDRYNSMTGKMEYAVCCSCCDSHTGFYRSEREAYAAWNETWGVQ